ncbi:hypothetical protein [Carboxylicivirga sediminis]|nr:hypothetical protein [Carboxylicivirga sediminis]
MRSKESYQIIKDVAVEMILVLLISFIAALVFYITIIKNVPF